MNDLLEAAHLYASRGWRVIPLFRVGGSLKMCSCKQGGKCSSPGKHPKDNAWQKAERLSGSDIQATWDSETPPNLGVATGADSGFWVLDIDPKSGGMESMAALVAQHGAMPTTWVAQTGSGGYHYGFALPDFEVRNDQSGRVGPGIDVRGQGGQIVAPPSITDKGSYVVICDVPPAPAPQWLLDLVYKPEVEVDIVTAEDLPKPEDLDEATWKRLSSYAQRAIDSELARLDACKAAATPNPSDYRGPAWNHTLFEVSCALLEFANSPWCAYSPGQAQRDVLARSPQDATFDVYTITKTFHSAQQKVGPKARPMPEDRRPPAEVDPMFNSPDDRSRANPPEGGGDQPNPAARQYPWRELFGGEKGTTPLYREMSLGVTDRGPVGWGRDNDFWSYADGVWKPDHYVVQHRLVDMLGNAYKTSHRSNTADIVQRHAQPISGDPLERLMNFRNGMLDWRTGELGDHDAEWGSTVQLGCEWLPEAVCPNFEGFLADVMHEDYVALAWEMIGYLMLSGNPLQMAFLFYGSGGNGKGTLIDVIRRLLGSENVASETLDDLNGNRFRSASLFGKIANLAGDIDATYQEHTAMFKSITGEDEITGEHKNMRQFRFESWAVPVFSANKFPGSADVTEGYLRRWTVLHFHKRIPESQVMTRKAIMALFEPELPGIAAKGVAALRKLMERGHFEPKGEAVKAKEEFARAIDQVRQWLTQGDVLGGPEVETPLPKLYANYVLWADRANHKRLKESEFSTRLESAGFPSVEVAGMVLHKGISVPEISNVTTNTFFG